MKKKINRSELIPEYGTALRSTLVSFVSSLPGYQEGIKKGFPLFTGKELESLKEQNKDGLTWEDIDRILSKKGIYSIKKPTFRKYIQENKISKAIGYRNTEKGRVAIFPADTISHINFILYYYKILNGEHTDNIIELIKDQKISYLDAIESNLNNYDNLGAAIYHYIFSENGDASIAIEKALAQRPDDRDEFLKRLNDIDEKFQNTIRTEIEELLSLLADKTMSVFETMGNGKENKNEQN